MAYLLAHFDERKQELARQIQMSGSVDEAMGVMGQYLKGLYRDMTGFYPVEQYRKLGFFLDAVHVSLQTVRQVGCHVDRDRSRPFENPDQSFGSRTILFGILVQCSILLVMLFPILSLPSTGDRSLLWALLIVSLGISIFLMSTFRKMESIRKRTPLSDIGIPVSIQVNPRMETVPTFLNHVADALGLGDSLFRPESMGRADEWITQQSGILTLFQDLLEARYFNDGQWALKKVSSLRAILQTNGITVEDYDPEKPEIHSHFDIEPCLDESVGRHLTIRPAFLRDNRVLLRGRAAEPMGEAGK